jgi:hypothetical protein
MLHWFFDSLFGIVLTFALITIAGILLYKVKMWLREDNGSEVSQKATGDDREGLEPPDEGSEGNGGTPES